MEQLYSILELIDEYERQRTELPHLSGLGELSEATVRYYQQKGLFRPAGSSGKEARYSSDTLWRIIFTRILQLQSAQVLNRKPTLPEIANILQGIDAAIIERIAKGREELSIGIMPETSGWQDYSSHPDIKLEIQGELSAAQQEQVRLIAKLLSSILQG
jgi:DNA-binding transcriptional MerR regulator